MSEPKFTPGPWRYNIATNGEVVQVSERGPDKTIVEADAANPWGSRLISAAPRMYDALDALSKGEGLPPGETIESILSYARGETQ